MILKPHVDAAPGLKWRARADHWVAVWVCRDDISGLGFSPKTHRIWPPTNDTGAALDHASAAMIRSECMRLQNEMLEFAHGSRRTAFDGTLKALCDAYETDPDSPFHKLRYRSRYSYLCNLKLIRLKGDRQLSSLSGRDFLRWSDELKQPEKLGEQPRIYRAHAVITMLRVLFGFGITFEVEKTPPGLISQCARLKAILTEMEFEQGAARTEVLTADQAIALRAEAHAQDWHSVAMAQALQFELSVRQKDVIGDWVPLSDIGISEITNGQWKWMYGIRWEEIDAHMILRHQMSKSRKRKILIFDLSLYPMVMEEIARVPLEKRTGPMVIHDENGLPWTSRNFSNRWRKLARSAGIPDSVWNMDSRAGGITEGTEATDGDLESVRHQAGHSDIKTTQRYSRSTLRRTQKVAVLRVAQRGKNVPGT